MLVGGYAVFDATDRADSGEVELTARPGSVTKYVSSCTTEYYEVVF